MKMKQPMLKKLGLVASALLCCVSNLPAQTAPTITTQPASQTNLAESNVTFSVAVAGTGPFIYQWQFNGTNLPNNIITTAAGGGSGDDGGAATIARLNSPYGVGVDAAGNLYIADTSDQRIRKVDINGIITSVAGNGIATYAGDGGAALNASLSHPYGAALDAAGNLFIADEGNNRIRKVDAHGVITTVAGSGTNGYFGDGGAATNASLSSPYGVAVDAAGDVFIADFANNRIRKVDINGIITTVAGTDSAAASGDGGVATNASLSNPTGVALNAGGELFIADYYHNRIRKVDPNGIITTVAGGGSGGDGGAATNAGLGAPWGVALDAAGNLYIPEPYNQRVRMVDTNGIITTVAGNSIGTYAGDGGAPTNASLHYPSGVALDANGNFYIADSYNNRIRMVVPPGSLRLTIAYVGARNAGNYKVVITSPYGSVTSAVATLIVQAPPAITVQPASQLAVAGSSLTFSVAVTGSGPFGYAWYFANTHLLQSSTNGTLILPSVLTNNAGNYTVVVTNAWGSVTSQVATLTVGLAPSVTAPPASQLVLAGSNVSFDVTAGGTGPFTYQWQFNGTNLPNNIITTVAGGSSGGDGGAATNAGLESPSGVAIDGVGNLYIAETGNNCIRKVDTNGIISTLAGNGTAGNSGDGGAATNARLNSPFDLALDAAGSLYIADTYNSRIRKVDSNGIITTAAGGGSGGDGGPATNARLNSPFGVGVDAAGNLYISDNFATIRKVGANGIITTVAGGGFSNGDGLAATHASLNFPSQITFDAAGALYIADSADNRIRKVGTNGIIATVAGNATSGEGGDGGAATNATLGYPTGVAVDTSGNLFIADYGGDRIREVGSNGIITTVAGGGTAYPGDGGAATNVGLDLPQRLCWDASGNLYFGDTGHGRVHELHLAGIPALSLANASANNAGHYSVVITSPYGSVTSAVATLTVTIPTTPPQIVASGGYFGFLTNQFGFDLSGAFGQTIVVDGSSDLVRWMPLFTNTVSGNPFYFCDLCWTNFPARFYRARLQ